MFISFSHIHSLILWWNKWPAIFFITKTKTSTQVYILNNNTYIEYLAFLVKKHFYA